MKKDQSKPIRQSNLYKGFNPEVGEYAQINRATMMELCHRGVTDTAFVVYCILCSHANMEGRKCNPSQKYIASIIGCHVSTVKEAIKKLDAKGFIKTKGNRKGGKQTSNSYQIYTAIGKLHFEGNDETPSQEDDSLPEYTQSDGDPQVKHYSEIQSNTTQENSEMLPTDTAKQSPIIRALKDQKENTQLKDPAPIASPPASGTNSPKGEVLKGAGMEQEEIGIDPPGMIVTNPDKIEPYFFPKQKYHEWVQNYGEFLAYRVYVIANYSFYINEKYFGSKVDNWVINEIAIEKLIKVQNIFLPLDWDALYKKLDDIVNRVINRGGGQFYIDTIAAELKEDAT